MMTEDISLKGMFEPDFAPINCTASLPPTFLLDIFSFSQSLSSVKCGSFEIYSKFSINWLTSIDIYLKDFHVHRNRVTVTDQQSAIQSNAWYVQDCVPQSCWLLDCSRHGT